MPVAYPGAPAAAAAAYSGVPAGWAAPVPAWAPSAVPVPPPGWGAPGPGWPVLPPLPRRRPVALVPLLIAAALVSLLVTGVGVVALVRWSGERTAAAEGAPGRAAPDAAPGSAAGLDADPEQVTAAIRTTLAVMTDAVRRRDEARYLTAVDPRVASTVTRQRAVFRALAALPLQAPEYTLADPDHYDDVVSTEPSGAATAVVRFTYRFSGWDGEAVSDPLLLTFSPSDGRMLLSGDTGERKDLDAGPFAEPWMTGVKILVERRPHVLVIGDAARRGDLVRLATRLEKVVGEVRRVWPERTWNGRVVAYASLDRRFVAEWFGDQAADGERDNPDGDPSFEARVASMPVVAGDGGNGPSRLVVTPYLLRQADAYSLSVLRHEVTHVATDHMGRYPPAWLLEGAAEYTGFRLGGTRVDATRTFGQHGVPDATGRAMLAGTWRPRLVNDGRAFYEGTSESVESGYVDGWIACLYVADRYGDATLRQLYQVASAQPESAGWDDVDAAALRTVLKTDHARFTAAVRTYGIHLRKSFA